MMNKLYIDDVNSFQVSVKEHNTSQLYARTVCLILICSSTQLEVGIFRSFIFRERKIKHINVTMLDC